MSKASAGLLLYRMRADELQILLVHLGGPFWIKKDVWFVPKGEIEPGEDEFVAARREFQEELGLQAEGEFLPLGSVKNKSGKKITAWAFASDCDPAALRSNIFRMEWPPKSGKMAEFPEIDRAKFFTVKEAQEKMNAAEFELVIRLQNLLRKTA